MQVFQQTIAAPVSIRGLGLHSGKSIHARLLPAPADSGVVFRRVDLSPPAEVRADSRNVVDTRLATCLGYGRARVSTVEHLLAALAALGVDNLTVEIDGAELPILDGSAAQWILLVRPSQLVAQEAPKKFIRVLRRVDWQAQDGRRASFSPFAGARHEIRIEFPTVPVVRASGRRLRFDLTPQGFIKEIARARTFCHVRDVERMRKSGRARGGSLENAVVFDDYRVLNPGGLRYPDEFARHKMLDVIGDCFINGHLVVGCLRATCPGHSLNHALMRELMESRGAWEWARARPGADGIVDFIRAAAPPALRPAFA